MSLTLSQKPIWNGLHDHAFMEKAMCAGDISSPVAQISFPINHLTRVPAAPVDMGIGTLEGASPLRSLPFLSMAGESGIMHAMVLPGNHWTTALLTLRYLSQLFDRRKDLKLHTMITKENVV